MSFFLFPYHHAPVGGGPYLDDLTAQPRCAYGMRKLISTATYAMRVRNRQTTVETDIGFIGDTLDVGTLNSTFTGTQTVDVVKLYDQTGNGYHLEQATVSSMPTIVLLGSYHGTVRWGGTELLATSGSLPMGTPRWAVYARKKFAAGATKVFIELSSNASGSNAQAAFVYSAASNRLYAYSQNSGGQARQGWFDCFNTMVQHTIIFDRSISGAGELVVRQNGSGQTITPSGGSTEQTGNFNSYPLYVGARADLSLGASMDLDNLAIYDADTASDMPSIESIIGTAP